MSECYGEITLCSFFYKKKKREIRRLSRKNQLVEDGVNVLLNILVISLCFLIFLILTVTNLP